MSNAAAIATTYAAEVSGGFGDKAALRFTGHDASTFAEARRLCSINLFAGNGGFTHAAARVFRADGRIYLATDDTRNVTADTEFVTHDMDRPLPSRGMEEAVVQVSDQRPARDAPRFSAPVTSRAHAGGAGVIYFFLFGAVLRRVGSCLRSIRTGASFATSITSSNSVVFPCAALSIAPPRISIRRSNASTWVRIDSKRSFCLFIALTTNSRSLPGADSSSSSKEACRRSTTSAVNERLFASAAASSRSFRSAGIRRFT